MQLHMNFIETKNQKKKYILNTKMKRNPNTPVKIFISQKKKWGGEDYKSHQKTMKKKKTKYVCTSNHFNCSWTKSPQSHRVAGWIKNNKHICCL